MSSLNANNTTGLVYTGDASGTLQLQTLGSNALSINTLQVVTVNSSTAATSASTGALVVSGGIGTGGNIYASGNIYQGGQVMPTLATVAALNLAF